MKWLRYTLADLLTLVAELAARVDAHYADSLNPKDQP